jgi:RNA polymerase sigma-70 factor (ECF subfamily)
MPDAKVLFEALAREHADMLTAFLRAALGNGSDADDLFQETMIVAWRRLDEFDQTRPFAPWLRGIAKKLVLGHRRKGASRPCTAAILDQIDSRLGQLQARPGDTWQDKLDLLHACVEALPSHYRQAVGLRYFEEKSIQQVSHSLKRSIANVKKRLQRARALVSECIDRKLHPVDCVP